MPFVTPYSLAQRYVGITELAENGDHPLISWWHSLCREDGKLDTPDETAWCSAFANGIAWELRLPRSKSAMARSWLKVGVPVNLNEAAAGQDVVVLWRGEKDGPLGHVGFFAGLEDGMVLVLGGNTHDAVAVGRFPASQILGIRRISE